MTTLFYLILIVSGVSRFEVWALIVALLIDVFLHGGLTFFKRIIP